MLNIKLVELEAAATAAAISSELEPTSARRMEWKEGSGVRRSGLIIKISEHILISPRSLKSLLGTGETN